ncbi:MAG: MarR family transcriptional regulator [Bacteroidota bacterium]
MSEPFFQAIFQIIRTGHRITDQVSQKLKADGFTEPQYNVLRILRGAKGKPLTVQTIQERMVQRSSNVTRIIDKLLAKECVVRKECPSNRRKMDITLTDTGNNVLKQLDAKVYALHKPMMDRLEDHELDLLKDLILKLITTKDE